MIKLNRIGYKLGLAGAVGVLLAIGMAAIKMMTDATVSAVNDRAGRSQRVSDSSLAANLAMRQMELAGRNIRLALVPAEVEKNVALLERLKATETSQLEAALASDQKLETKERLQKIKSLMDRFAAGVEEIAKAQAALLAQTDKRSAISGEWTKALDAELASPVLAKLDNRAEVEKLLHQADAKVNALRAMVWRLGVTGDAGPIDQIAKTQTALKTSFNLLRGEADDRELLSVISSLDSVVKRFLAANDDVVKTEALKGDILANRSVKFANEAAELMEMTVSTAQKNTAEVPDEGPTETTQA